MVSFKMKLKNVSQAPRKIGEAAALIRSRSVDDALVILAHTPRRAAGALTKLLTNARATARQQHRLKADSLVIEEIFVVSGRHLPTRWRRGVRSWKRLRGTLPYKRRRSHVYLTVKGEPAGRPKTTAVKKTAQKDKEAEHGTKG